MTHPPTLYEELIQKYELDIRNHIKIEQQMKLYSDSLLSKLEDKDKQLLKMQDKIDLFKKKAEEDRIDTLMIKEENQAIKKTLEKYKVNLKAEQELKEANVKIKKLENDLSLLRK